MALTRDQILKHSGTYTSKEVHVPEWSIGGDDVVLVRGMTIREFEINQSRVDDGLSTAALIVRCVLDEAGLRVFSDTDTAMVAELPLSSIKRLSEAIADLSGLNDKGEADVAVAEGNSDAAPSGDSSSS
jgi:hypothetical protein